MSVNIDKTLWQAAMGENTWPTNILPYFKMWLVRTQIAVGVGDILWGWWEDGYLEIGGTKGTAGNNELKTYGLTFGKLFDFGTYQVSTVLNTTPEAGQLMYPLLFESLMGGAGAVPPPGSSVKAGHIIICINGTTEQAQTGYDGAETTTPFAGWDPTVEATLRVEWTATSVKYYVDGVLKVTHNTNVPQNQMPYCLEWRQDHNAGAYANDITMFVKNFAEV
jgi:hypothetical protein